MYKFCCKYIFRDFWSHFITSDILLTLAIEEERANFILWRLYFSRIVSHLFLEKKEVPSVCKVETKPAKIMKEDAIL